MPHLILEYSSNVKEKDDFHKLFSGLHQILVDIAKANLESCKSRAVEHNIFYIGDGSSNHAFVHLEIRLAEGRSFKVREEVGQKALEALERFFSQSLKNLDLQITVESTEFLRNLYFKIPEGSI